MIIDARLRPPTDYYLSSTTDIPGFDTYYKRFGVERAPSLEGRSMELCFQEMDKVGVTLALCPARWGWGKDPLVPADEVVRVMQEYPGRFYGAVAVDGSQTRRAFSIIEEYVLNGPVKAVCMEPGISQTPLYIDDKRLYPIYDFLQEREIPLFLMGGGANGPDLSYQDAVHMDRMLVDFPNLTVIDIHANVPFVQQAIMVALRRPNLFLCPDMYLDNTPFMREFVDAMNCMLQDQIVYGSSYPFIGIVEGYELFMKMPIKKDVLPKIFYENAARALKLDSN